MEKLKLNYKWINITIILEKGYNEDTPNQDTPIQYNEFSIKRVYKKWISTKPKGKKYMKRTIYSTLMSSQSDKLVKQEPLLDFH